MDHVLTIAASGLRTAERAFTAAASDTLSATLPAPLSSSAAPSSVTPPPRDLASGIVGQIEARASFRANLAVYRTANDLYRSLLKATAGPATR